MSNLSDFFPSALVTSVNSETGDVELDHTDVGAAAASHTHTVSDITDFSPTYADGDGQTATAGGHYLLSEGATLTLPASPDASDRVHVVPKGDWASSNATIGRNSSNIAGAAEDLTLDQSIGIWLVYSGASYGWALA